MVFEHEKDVGLRRLSPTYRAEEVATSGLCADLAPFGFLRAVRRGRQDRIGC
jgi:hypothetical protein